MIIKPVHESCWHKGGLAVVARHNVVLLAVHHEDGARHLGASRHQWGSIQERTSILFSEHSPNCGR